MPIDAALILPDSKLSSSVAKLRADIVQNLENAQSIIKSNTELAQQKMKTYYDLKATPVLYDIGSRVWVYTPKNRQGLSKKLQHNYHGPYRIVAKLSPVHFKLRTLDNRPLSVPVHANRLKPYHDPADRPIEPPATDPSLPDLSDPDLPPDSFAPEPTLPSSQLNAPHIEKNSDVFPSNEPPITRPEDANPPEIILPAKTSR